MQVRSYEQAEGGISTTSAFYGCRTPRKFEIAHTTYLFTMSVSDFGAIRWSTADHKKNANGLDSFQTYR